MIGQYPSNAIDEEDMLQEEHLDTTTPTLSRPTISSNNSRSRRGMGSSQEASASSITRTLDEVCIIVTLQFAATLGCETVARD